MRCSCTGACHRARPAPPAAQQSEDGGGRQRKDRRAHTRARHIPGHSTSSLRCAPRPARIETETPLDERIDVGLFTAQPGTDAFDATEVIVIDRRPIRSGAQVVTSVTDRRPTHAGIDPYSYYIDRNSRDTVRPLADPD